MHTDPEECLVIVIYWQAFKQRQPLIIPMVAVSITTTQADFKTAEICIPSLALLKVVDSTEEDEIALAVSE